MDKVYTMQKKAAAKRPSGRSKPRKFRVTFSMKTKGESWRVILKGRVTFTELIKDKYLLGLLGFIRIVASILREVDIRWF